ncbi:uncharacterized protein F4807DRAFT_448500, partial [Annulohypoxylon truncatum]|uniref:uncharacterized protein n=1 Tax=Annulohypoxylon truncatum TaxID=327061 RepID=UPI0020083336
MVDLGGSLAVASMGLYATGVSTDLNVTYLSSGGQVGDKLSGTAICDLSEYITSPRSKLRKKTSYVSIVGRRLAYTSITFKNAKGELTARGSHTKYVANAWKGQETPFVPPEGVEIEED